MESFHPIWKRHCFTYHWPLESNIVLEFHNTIKHDKEHKGADWLKNNLLFYVLFSFSHWMSKEITADVCNKAKLKFTLKSCFIYI